MTVQEAYDTWSDTYDADANRTRDLDQFVTNSVLSGRRFNSILEIGCGTGKNTPLLAKIGNNVMAIDFSERMLLKARGKTDSKNVTFAVADISKQWPSADQSVDLIVCNLVLEHIENIDFVFSEAKRTLIQGGHFFICELHPIRQHEGTTARFVRDQGTTEIQAFVHHVSDFLGAAKGSGLKLNELKEWWHDDDLNKPPRLVSFMFAK